MEKVTWDEGLVVGHVERSSLLLSDSSAAGKNETVRFWLEGLSRRFSS